MKKSFSIQITEPCHEDWSMMTPTDRGAFCAACSKEVRDYRHATEYQIYQAVKDSTNVCGRFNNHQLNKPISIAPPTSQSWKRVAAALVSVFTLYRVHAANPDQMPIPKDSLRIIDTLKSADTTSAYRCLYITGRVFDIQSNYPLAHAEVKIPGTGLIITCDSLGLFTLDTSVIVDDHMKSIRLLIKSDNYETKYVTIDSDAASLDIGLNQKFTICNSTMGDVVLTPPIYTDVTGIMQMTPEEYPGFKESVKSIFWQREPDESGINMKRNNESKPRRKSPPLAERLSLWMRTRRRELSGILRS